MGLLQILMFFVTFIKFKVFLSYSIALGSKKIATGHYAKINNINLCYLATPKDCKRIKHISSYSRL